MSHCLFLQELSVHDSLEATVEEPSEASGLVSRQDAAGDFLILLGIGYCLQWVGVQWYLCVCARVCVCTRVCTCMYIIRVCVCVCVCVCMCVCVCVCVCV